MTFHERSLNNHASTERVALKIKDLECVLCPYCRAWGLLYFMTEATRFFYCAQCDLYFRARSNEDWTRITAYYEFECFDNLAYDQMEGRRDDVFDDMLDLIENEKSDKGNLLDIGCGCGHFLRKAKDRGWQVSGIDPSQKSIEYARGMLGNAVQKDIISNHHPDRLFDVITLINVADHLRRPWTDIDRVKDFLKSGGRIWLRFPNGCFHPPIMKICAAIGLQQQAYQYLIFHEYSFTPRFIRKMLSDLNYVDVKVMPAKMTGGEYPLMRLLTSSFLKKLFLMSGHRALWTSSIIATAKKKHN
jgi:2-polyprenyl-3-methyl-5-hydroxy-6-metoxy-1,4-benzoquinol methylase